MGRKSERCRRENQSWGKDEELGREIKRKTEKAPDEARERREGVARKKLAKTSSKCR